MNKEEKPVQNADIRARTKETGIPLWRIADELSVSEMTITRKMRREMEPAEKVKIFSIIDRLEAEAKREEQT